MHVLGFLAAILSPFMMTIGFIVWDQTWKGSAVALNIFKCSLASGMFIITVLIIGGSSIDTYGSIHCGMLIVSSILGIVIGDVAWLQALQMLGARRVILVDSLKPFLASLLGYFILGESVSAVGCVGMFVTIVGVCIVSLESVHEEPGIDIKERTDASGDRPTYNSVHGIDIEVSPMHNDILGDPKQTPNDNQDAVGNVALPQLHCTQHDMREVSNLKLVSIQSDMHMNSTMMSPMHLEDTEIIRLQEISQAESKPAQEGMPSQLQCGYIFAILNVIFDSYGAVLTKEFGAVFTLSEINLVRFGFAAMALGSLSSAFRIHSLLKDKSIYVKTIEGKWGISVPTISVKDTDIYANNIEHTVPNSYGEPLTSDENHSDLNWYEFPCMAKFDWAKIAIGVVFVTYACPSLFNYALFRLKLGLCLTLTSLGPIFSIPLVYIMKHEKTSVRAIGGSVLSFVGVTMLCLSESA